MGKIDLNNLNERLGYIERIIHYLLQDPTMDPIVLEKINRCIKQIYNEKDDWEHTGYNLDAVSASPDEEGNPVKEYDE